MLPLGWAVAWGAAVGGGKMVGRFIVAAAVVAAGWALAEGGGQATLAQDNPADAVAAEATTGPFIADPAVVLRLDRKDASGGCAKSGALVFGCLIQGLAEAQTHEPPVGALANPFNLKVAADIRSTIEQDLNGFRMGQGIGAEQQIHPEFLNHPASRLELVGVVNRIDRQFIHDVVPGAEDHTRCGEVSLIYRFSYTLKADVSSRLPVTMNVVLPAIPRAYPGVTTCRQVAARWLAATKAASGKDPDAAVAILSDPASGVIPLIDGRDIERIELNIQAYRISAGSDRRDLGSTAEYVIRVFRWNPDQKRFTPSYLTNQIDRARLLGNPKGDANSCDPGVSRPMSLSQFRSYLLSPVVLSDIDTGTLNIPREYLACRAVTVSPGGATRSANTLYWNAASAAQQLLTDAQIAAAMNAATTPSRQFSFMKSPDDVRLRLSELSCSGCHQARAIAGFHFPGADREDTAVSNAVFLAGSPHFYGDQVRRRKILEAIAAGDELSRYQLAASYASRPLNKFREDLKATKLIGGWGGACMTPEAMATSQRQWTCRQPDYECVQVFRSANAPGLGVCLPKGRREIGDPLQVGDITTASFGSDRYLRSSPARVGDWSDRDHRDTRIPASALPPDPPGNSYYGAHQEFYRGDDTGGTGTPAEQRRTKRDALTGGFPGGMLRLSECVDLPGEATCGLVASSGFNACLDQVVAGTKTLSQCFAQKTSYAGMRACDAANPCRDDYICLKPMGYTAANGKSRFEARRAVVSYDPEDFGQKAPDEKFLSRYGGKGDPRGICIPPYFVFQFRSDGHPAPMSKALPQEP